MALHAETLGYRLPNGRQHPDFDSPSDWLGQTKVASATTGTSATGWKVGWGGYPSPWYLIKRGPTNEPDNISRICLQRVHVCKQVSKRMGVFSGFVAGLLVVGGAKVGSSQLRAH